MGEYIKAYNEWMTNSYFDEETKQELKAYIYDTLGNTPQVSFSVRHLGCVAWIVITASHNLPEYNAYKVLHDIA